MNGSNTFLQGASKPWYLPFRKIPGVSGLCYPSVDVNNVRFPLPVYPKVRYGGG